MRFRPDAFQLEIEHLTIVDERGTVPQGGNGIRVGEDEAGQQERRVLMSAGLRCEAYRIEVGGPPVEGGGGDRGGGLDSIKVFDVWGRSEKYLLAERDGLDGGCSGFRRLGSHGASSQVKCKDKSEQRKSLVLHRRFAIAS